MLLELLPRRFNKKNMFLNKFSREVGWLHNERLLGAGVCEGSLSTRDIRAVSGPRGLVGSGAVTSPPVACDLQQHSFHREAQQGGPAVCLCLRR